MNSNFKDTTNENVFFPIGMKLKTKVYRIARISFSFYKVFTFHSSLGLIFWSS